MRLVGRFDVRIARLVGDAWRCTCPDIIAQCCCVRLVPPCQTRFDYMLRSKYKFFWFIISGDWQCANDATTAFFLKTSRISGSILIGSTPWLINFPSFRWTVQQNVIYIPFTFHQGTSFLRHVYFSEDHVLCSVNIWSTISINKSYSTHCNILIFWCVSCGFCAKKREPRLLWRTEWNIIFMNILW